MNPYPSYKPSGIDWLGEIPSHWNVIPGRYCAEFTYGFPADSGAFSNTKIGIPLIRIRDIFSQDTEVYYEGLDYPKSCIINTGDILIGMDGDFNVARWKGGMALLNQRVCKFQYSKTLRREFVYYFLPLALKIINNTKYATTVKHLSAQDLSDMRFIIPPFSEQEIIAAYLDEKTAKIDALVAEKQAQVEDLRKYRSSLITEIETRGLNPDAPLRPSGIEWLGDIPNHWKIAKLKYYIEINSGDAIAREDIFTNGRFPVYGGGEKIGFANTFNVDANTIIIGRVGVRCGCVRLIDECAWATDNALICTTSQNPKYISTLLEAANLNRLNESNAQPLITSTKVKNLIVALPSLPEQEAIASYLDEKTSKIDEAIAELEAQLKGLDEYKKAVITEAVTGKVDVRDWIPKE